MGTRHITMVLLDGEYKVAQYGQWDGYPSGQGAKIVDFIQKMDKERFITMLKNVRFITDDEVEERWIECGAVPGTLGVSIEVSNAFKEIYPELSRNTGSNVLNLIYQGRATELSNHIDFTIDGLYCEWGYLIDMDNDMLEVYIGGMTDPIPRDERFYTEDLVEYRIDATYYPIRLLYKFPFERCEDFLRLHGFLTFISNFRHGLKRLLDRVIKRHEHLHNVERMQEDIIDRLGKID